MKKFYSVIIVLLLIVCAYNSFGQPQIVTALRDWGAKSGGSAVRTNLPGMAPGLIYSFDNTSPHDPAGGVVHGNANWLYGSTNDGGNNHRGTFYRVREDGTLLQTLFHFADIYGYRATPFYHTDGYVYFADAENIRKYNTATGVISSFPRVR